MVKPKRSVFGVPFLSAITRTRKKYSLGFNEALAYYLKNYLNAENGVYYYRFYGCNRDKKVMVFKSEEPAEAIQIIKC